MSFSAFLGAAHTGRQSALAFALLSTLLMTACGGEGEPTQTRVVGKNNPTQCEFQPGDGSLALMSNAGQKDYVTSDYFGKPYNRPDLEAVLGASGKETAKYADTMGLKLFRIPYNGPEDRCLYQESIEVAPQNILEWWQKRSGGRLNDAKAGTDGLFTYWNFEGDYKQIVLVRTSSDRWTLVHELMHANFDSTREALMLPWGFTEETMKRTSLKAQDALSKFNDSRTEENLMSAVNAYAELAEDMKVTLVNSALEEVANESLLINEFALGKLKSVTVSAAQGAAWYINCSRQKALTRLAPIAADIASLDKTAKSYGYEVVSAKASTLVNELYAIDQRALELALRAKAVSGISDEGFACDNNNRDTQARLASENPHLIQMIDNNPSVKMLDEAIRDLSAAKAKIRARNAAGKL